MLPNYETPASIPDHHRGTATFRLRYEDLSQDGRLILDCAAHALGEAVWRPVLSRDPGARAAMKAGIIPILSRLAILGEPGPFSVDSPMTANGAFQLAHAVGAEGQVDRLLLNMWVDIAGPVGHTRAPLPREGRSARAARIYAEHTFTRLFAPPDQRKVLRLDIEGTDPVPKARAIVTPPPDIARLPEGSLPLDGEPSPDTAPFALGLRHTDANQHVNSLVYLQIFEEAALRRFAALGKKVDVLAREFDIAYRKPLFAGQSVRVVLRAFERGDRLGAVGWFVDERELANPAAKPNAFVRMIFE